MFTCWRKQKASGSCTEGFFLFCFHSSSHLEVCLFLDPGQPESWKGAGTRIRLILKGRSRVSAPSTGTLQRSTVSCCVQVIRRPWRAHRPRRCRCSTWWGGTPRRGSTPQTSYGGRWTPGCTFYSPCSTDGWSSRDLETETEVQVRRSAVSEINPGGGGGAWTAVEHFS